MAANKESLTYGFGCGNAIDVDFDDMLDFVFVVGDSIAAVVVAVV